MKPVLEFVANDLNEGFHVILKDFSYFPTPWHFHPEYEIVLVTESVGKRFVGDNISNFGPGSLTFLGTNLPHTFKNDFAYYEPTSGLKAQSIVIQFLDTALGDFLSLPETKKINQLFAKSARGMDITGESNVTITKKILELLQLKGLLKWMKLLEILHLLSETKDYKFISSGAIIGSNEKESERIENVLKFMLDNFGRDIKLSDVAKVAFMSENSFSKFFKDRTNKTFTGYLNELRLSHAAKLLIETDNPVVDICYECGFNNLSNFHRYFRQAYQSSPVNYRENHK